MSTAIVLVLLAFSAPDPVVCTYGPACFQEGLAAFERGDYAASLPRFVRACELGDPAGCTNVGWQYEHALGVAADAVRARPMYLAGCDGGDVSGCGCLGKLYLTGAGVPANFDKYLELFQKACDLGDAALCAHLATRYKKGDGVRVDAGRSRALDVQACELGSAAGCNNLGAAKWASGNAATGMRLFKRACDLGSQNGCDNFNRFVQEPAGAAAVAASDPEGLAQQAIAAYRRSDHAASASLSQRACELGSVRGCNLFGLHLELGQGVAPDVAKARTHYTRECDAGDWSACANLARVHFQGIGGAASVPKAIAFYQRACDLGDATNCAHMGFRNQQGEGVPKDGARASVLYARACDLGDPIGCNNLGGIQLASGTDSAGSVRNFQRACDLRYMPACDYLVSIGKIRSYAVYAPKPEPAARPSADDSAQRPAIGRQPSQVLRTMCNASSQRCIQSPVTGTTCITQFNQVPCGQ